MTQILLEAVFLLVIILNVHGLPQFQSDKPKVPIYKCEQNGNKCVFRNIQLTETEPEWQPTADDVLSVKIVEVLNSNIPIITNNICRAFPNLESFIHAGQNVKEIKPDAFYSCTKVTYFWLAANQIKKLDKNLFQYSTKAANIGLYDNQISELDMNIFTKLPNLYTIQFALNNITSFPMELLKNNRRITSIHLDANELSDFDVEKMLEYLPLIEFINLDKNEISCVQMVEMYKILFPKKVTMGTSELPKVRYYNVEKVNGLTCVPDVEWSAAHYRKGNERVSSQPMTKNILGVLRESEAKIEKLEKTQSKILEVLCKILRE